MEIHVLLSVVCTYIMTQEGFSTLLEVEIYGDVGESSR